MKEVEILHHISQLIDREHQLRALHEDGAMNAEEETSELAAVGVELDRCWNLLQQRHAGTTLDADRTTLTRPAPVADDAGTRK